MVQRALVAGATLGLTALGVAVLPGLEHLLASAESIRQAALSLGPLAPLVLVALNALQIVVAPVPATVMQLAAGYLFGPWWGTFYSALGMVIGAVAAFLLARRFGAPLLQRLVPPTYLQPWLRVRHFDSTWAWALILLLPIGDFVYYLAGLTSLSLPRMLTTALVVRMPSIILAVVAGAEVTSIPSALLPIVTAVAVAVGALLFWQKDRLQALIFERAMERALKQDGEHERDDHPHP